MKKLLIVALCIGVLTQCKKEEAEPEPQPALTTYTPPTGSITGKANQYDPSGASYTTNLNTATVSLLNTNISTVSDAAGNYTLNGVPSGMYTICIKRPGSRTCQFQQVSFPGSGVMFKDIHIADSATAIFSSATVKDTLQFSQHKMAVKINLIPSSTGAGALVIYSKTGIPDINNYSSFGTNYNYMSISANSSSAQSNIMVSGGAGTYNVRIYPYSNSPSYGEKYYDYPTAKYVFIGQGTPLPTTYTVTIQ